MDYDSIDAFLKAVEAVGEGVRKGTAIDQMKHIMDDASKAYEKAAAERKAAAKILSELHMEKKALKVLKHASEDRVIKAKQGMDELLDARSDASWEMAEVKERDRVNRTVAEERTNQIDEREKKVEKAEEAVVKMNEDAKDRLDEAASTLKKVNAKMDALRRMVA